jgi:hypothetical protein
MTEFVSQLGKRSSNAPERLPGLVHPLRLGNGPLLGLIADELDVAGDPTRTAYGRRAIDRAGAGRPSPG